MLWGWRRWGLLPSADRYATRDDWLQMQPYELAWHGLHVTYLRTY